MLKSTIKNINGVAQVTNYYQNFALIKLAEIITIANLFLLPTDQL